MKNTYSEQPDGRHNAPIICRCEGAEHTTHIARLFDSAACDLSGRHISSRRMMCGGPMVRRSETQQCSIEWRLTIDLLSLQFNSNSDALAKDLESFWLGESSDFSEVGKRCLHKYKNPSFYQNS